MFPRKKLPKGDEAPSEAPLLSPNLPSKASLVYEVDRAQQSRERLVDNSETTSDDDAGRPTKLTPAERVSANRRLQALEKRSMSSHNVNISTFEASELDFLSLIDKQEWKYVLRRIGNNPQSTKEKRDMELDGRQTRAFPLHLAVSKNPPGNVVDAMVAVHPNACKIPDDTFGQLPLHIACKFRASTEVLKCLLDSFPEAIRLTDTAEGRLPLHYACVDGYPYDISMLIAAEKRALTCKDAAGKTPVDLVNENTSPHRDHIIKRIFQVAKDDIKKSQRQAKEQQAPATPRKRNELSPPDVKAFGGSLSEMSDTTQEASNVRNMKKPAVKEKLIQSPVFRMDVDQTPEKQGLSPETPRRRSRQAESHTIGRPSHQKAVLLDHLPPESLLFSETEQKPSSNEPTTSRKKNRGQGDSVPDVVSNEMAMKLSPSKAKGSSSKRRTKNLRGEDSVPEIASLVGPPKTTDLSSRPDAASLSLELSLNESIDEDTRKFEYIQKKYFEESPHSRSAKSVPSPKASPTPIPNDSEIMALNTRLHILELRKAALVDECNRVSATVLEKSEKVQHEKRKLIEMKRILVLFQQLVDREQAAVDVAESSINVHEEILRDHKNKIKAADQELTSLVNKRNIFIRGKDFGEIWIRLEEVSTVSSSASSAEASTESEEEIDEWGSEVSV